MNALRRWFERSALLYVVFVLLPALGLVIIGLNSLDRQRQAVRDLINSNRQLAGERLTEELERATLESAEDCLHTVSSAP